MQIMTIHRAKGLEWRNVYLADVCAGRFPCSRSDDYDEELRLLFVAITRAKELCQVSFQQPRPGDDRSSFTVTLEQILASLSEDPVDPLTDTSND